MDENLAKIETRMGSGEPFTYGQLCIVDGHGEGRTADRAIQRWRKRGWIAYVRDRGVTTWSLTDVGKAAVLAPATPPGPTAAEIEETVEADLGQLARDFVIWFGGDPNEWNYDWTPHERVREWVRYIEPIRQLLSDPRAASLLERLGKETK